MFYVLMILGLFILNSETVDRAKARAKDVSPLW